MGFISHVHLERACRKQCAQSLEDNWTYSVWTSRPSVLYSVTGAGCTNQPKPVRSIAGSFKSQLFCLVCSVPDQTVSCSTHVAATTLYKLATASPFLFVSFFFLSQLNPGWSRCPFLVKRTLSGHTTTS